MRQTMTRWARFRAWLDRFQERHAPVMEECVRCMGWHKAGFIVDVPAHAGETQGVRVPVCFYCLGLYKRDERGALRQSRIRAPRRTW